MPRTISLDAVDWQILGQLQKDGDLSNVELARRVGLTPPPCLRRVQLLKASGLIRGYRALLDPGALGYSVTSFAFVNLASQAEQDLAAFAARVTAWKQVRECWTLSGDIDFVMKSVTRDLAEFQAFVGELIATPNVRNVRTALTISQVKEAGLVPLDD